ncbi:RES family NAD+ phosphorylase [Azorhizobium doebereinerae]|uniref:RES family NAD+ phosphorylase n=1 Tax=Azorhizobium doebereinerae TaxID=281091 RepID=UPI00048B8EEC|nr:RES family NAD+ phosphorylase [Azorhizobium doebereinerae]
MSSPIWTPAALASEARPYAGRVWRLVEAQHRVSTLKLVDTLAEQALLEDLIEDTKPKVPAECAHLPYLLASPFRYEPPYPHGSRFRRAGRTPGVYYAAETAETAVAEMAFYRLLFFAESPGTPWPRDLADYTAFAASVASSRALDLTVPPLDRDGGQWTHPIDYGPCQDLAEAARTGGAEILRYASVRDPGGGRNVAVLTCGAFSEAWVGERQTWRVRLSPSGVQAVCDFPDRRLDFPPSTFAVDPRIAALDWRR